MKRFERSGPDPNGIASSGMMQPEPNAAGVGSELQLTRRGRYRLALTPHDCGGEARNRFIRSPVRIRAARRATDPLSRVGLLQNGSYWLPRSAFLHPTGGVGSGALRSDLARRSRTGLAGEAWGAAPLDSYWPRWRRLIRMNSRGFGVSVHGRPPALAVPSTDPIKSAVRSAVR